jgi:hypothetical protein
MNALRNAQAIALKAFPPLARGKLRRDIHGDIWTNSGSFALVVAISDGTQESILKLFTRPFADLIDRYRAIEVETAKAGPARQYFLKCHAYDERPDHGFFDPFDNSWWAMLLMQVSPGINLKEYLGELLNRRDLTTIRQLADAWVQMILALKGAHLAHGDLQAANIFVVSHANYKNPQIQLIDYDGMYVPALAGRASISLGLPSYQHPARDLSHFDEHLDDFSALVVNLSLRALASGDLRILAKKEDDLVFSAEELTPAKPHLLRRLQSSRDTEVARLATELRRALDAATYGEIPCAVDTLDRSGAAIANLDAAIASDDDRRIAAAAGNPLLAGTPALSAHAARVAQARRWAPLFETLGRLLQGTDDRAAVDFWDSSGFVGYQPASRFAPEVAQLRRRTSAWNEIQAALAAGDDQRVARFWDESLFVAYGPADARRSEIAASVARGQVLVELTDALAADDHDAVQRLAHDPRLTGATLPKNMAEQVGLHRFHMANVQLLQRALQSGSDWAIAAAALAANCRNLAPEQSQRIDNARARLAQPPQVLGAEVIANDRLSVEVLSRGGSTSPGDAQPSNAGVAPPVQQGIRNLPLVVRFKEANDRGASSTELAERFEKVEAAGVSWLLRPSEIEVGRRAISAQQVSALMNARVPKADFLSTARSLGVDLPYSRWEELRRLRDERVREAVLKAAMKRGGVKQVAWAASRMRLHGVSLAGPSAEMARESRVALGRALR